MKKSVKNYGFGNTFAVLFVEKYGLMGESIRSSGFGLILVFPFVVKYGLVGKLVKNSGFGLIFVVPFVLKFGKKFGDFWKSSGVFGKIPVSSRKVRGFLKTP